MEVVEDRCCVCRKVSQTQNYKLLPIYGRHSTNFRLQPYQHTADSRGLFKPIPKTTIYSRSRKKTHSELSRHFHTQNPTNIKTAIYLKPTFKDTINPYNSSHHTHHKYAAVRFLFNWLKLLQPTRRRLPKRANNIHNILYNTSFPIKPQKPPTHNRTRSTATSTTKQNTTSFTYVGKETFYIYNLFRKTELKISFRTANTIGKLLSHKKPNPDYFSLSGICELTCPDCNKAYVGQTRRRFATSFKEHEKAYGNNSHTSSLTKHLN